MEELIAELAGLIGTRDFAGRARSVLDAFKTLRPLIKSDRESLWADCQEAWEEHKSMIRKQAEDSDMAFRELEYALYMDTSPDGQVLGGIVSRGDWEGMGAKLAQAKGILDELEDKIRNDARLLPRHRHTLFQKLHDQRYRLGQARESTWDELYDQASELYNQTYDAIDTLHPRDALDVFKRNQSLVLSLYLRRSDKEKLAGWFQELWAKLQAQFDERRREREQKRTDWIARQEEGLSRLLEAREKVSNFIGRLEENISQNNDRLYSARSDDFADRVSQWIREDEDKLRDAQSSLEALNRKIEDAEGRLRRA